MTNASVKNCRVCGARLDLWQVSRDGGVEIRIYQCPNRHETWSYNVATGEWTVRDEA
jgi:hypothetical protein